MSASGKKPWKRFIRRAKVQGGGRGEVQGTSRSNNVAALVGRLRRLEVVVMYLAGHREYVRKLSRAEVDNLLDAIYTISDVQQPVGSGGANVGDEVSLPHSGPADGQTEGETGVDG